MRRSRDAHGRRVIEYVSYGVVRVRIVDVGAGMGEVYTSVSARFLPAKAGPISFTTWDDPADLRGTAPPVRPSWRY